MHKLFAAAVVVVSVGCGPVDPCPAGGTATVRLELHGVEGSRASVSLTAPDGGVQTLSTTHATETVELAAAPSGAWSARAERFTAPSGLIRTVYEATPSPATFCVSAGGTQVVDVSWHADPASNTLWALNANGNGNLVSFGAAELASSGAPASRSTGNGPFGHDVAFDRDGNLWSLGGTTADATIVRSPARALIGSGAKTSDVNLTVAGLSCLPGAAGLAFDADGNLWVSAPCAHQVMKVKASDLGATATVTPAVVLSGLMAPMGLAFDHDGNLWVADEDLQRIVRFDRAALASSTSTPSAQLAVRASANPLDMTLRSPGWLAFDALGNLWADDFGANVVLSVARADLAEGGDRAVNPPVQITLAVNALLHGLAFDDAAGLWVAGGQGKLMRLSAAQLSASSGPGMPTTPETIISSADIGYVSNVALYPAPAALPLFSALP